ncbi:hypothetical protein DQF64_05710 [Moraxella bovis]|nr:hypothetical protein DQF64_05710 [Moraxella bovis]
MEIQKGNLTPHPILKLHFYQKLVTLLTNFAKKLSLNLILKQCKYVLMIKIFLLAHDNVGKMFLFL